MRKEFLQSHFFQFKTNVLTLAIKLNALWTLLEKVIFSAMEKNPKSCFQLKLCRPLEHQQCESAGDKIPDLETKAEIVSLNHHSSNEVKTAHSKRNSSVYHRNACVVVQGKFVGLEEGI